MKTSKRTRRVTVTELSSMGKCESMTLLKTKFEEHAHDSVKEAARRGTQEHLVFEKQGRDSRCFVASWAVGENHWVTEELRTFRDQYLLKSLLGRNFVSAYYASSPYLIEILKHIPGTKSMSSALLTWIATKLSKRG